MKQLITILLIVLTISSLIYYDATIQDDNIIYYHPSGCCMLNVVKQVSDEDITEYHILYHDYKLGDEYSSIEVSIVDMKFMVNEYVDHCTNNH